MVKSAPERRGMHVERSRRRDGRYLRESEGDLAWLRCFKAQLTHPGHPQYRLGDMTD